VNQLAHLVFIKTPGCGTLKLGWGQTAWSAAKTVGTKLGGEARSIDVQCLAAANTQRRSLRAQAI